MADEVSLIPREVLEAGFPTARSLFNDEQVRYEEAVKSMNYEVARNSLEVPLRGSNLFKVLLLNQIGIRTATLPELECALENGLDLRGSYEDAPSVLFQSGRDSYAPNDPIAKSLAKKLKLKSGDFKTPRIINGLRIVEDKDSAYGLNFDVENAQVISAPTWSPKNNGRKFSKINSDYSLNFSEDGSRTFYTRDNGVSWVYLVWSLDLDSGDGGLAYSFSDGRVVVLSGGATSQKSLEYIAQLTQEKERQNAELEQKFSRAISVLKE